MPIIPPPYIVKIQFSTENVFHKTRFVISQRRKLEIERKFQELFEKAWKKQEIHYQRKGQGIHGATRDFNW